MGDSTGQASAAATEVKNTGIHFMSGKHLFCSIYQHFAVHTRNQNIGCDDHRQPVKLPGA